MHPVPIFELAENYDLLIQTVNLSTFSWLPQEVKRTEWMSDVCSYCKNLNFMMISALWIQMGSYYSDYLENFRFLLPAFSGR
jgi:hypothetical protein